MAANTVVTLTAKVVDSGTRFNWAIAAAIVGGVSAMLMRSPQTAQAPEPIPAETPAETLPPVEPI
ncbi:MAG: hypothetical protein HC879_02960, partial [Leptolyngbyaceae cyanobacterium SL_5_9]|nr:hypothetical protein [Leptolyngbyaceae cyanobacterium SL_5_9]NJO75627.1 hypothetical protein [Leptolyngbyaceae cyanobacterium RM1_406_9]